MTISLASIESLSSPRSEEIEPKAGIAFTKMRDNSLQKQFIYIIDSYVFSFSEKNW